jgi:hypothetical protein
MTDAPSRVQMRRNRPAPISESVGPFGAAERQRPGSVQRAVRLPSRLCTQMPVLICVKVGSFVSSHSAQTGSRTGGGVFALNDKLTAGACLRNCFHN